MLPKKPAAGQLYSLDVVEGRNAVAAAKKLLKAKSQHGGISTWDASSIFFEMNNLELEGDDKPSPRTLILLYAADLFFRLRWEIRPALEEGKSVVAVPYVETGFALGEAVGLSKKWLHEVFRFAPPPTESFRLNGAVAPRLGNATSGFVEFCSSIMNQDLRPKFTTYFDDLERRGSCHSL